MLSEEIRRTRLKAGMTQRQFAAALGVTQQFVNQLERGIREIPMEDGGVFDRYLEVWEAVEDPDRTLDESQRRTLARGNEAGASRGPDGADGS